MNSKPIVRFASILIAACFWLPARAQEPALANLSVRSWVATGTPFVAGFTIAPGPRKMVLLRVVGPSLRAFGVSEALADPKLELYAGDGTKLAENDNFFPIDAETAASAGAFPLAAGGKDALLIVELSAGSYAVHAIGVEGTTGIALIEIYDLSGGSNRISNLSSRTTVGNSDRVVVAGFALSPGPGTRRVLLRAVGYTPRAFEVADAMVDPKLEVFAGPTRLAENDNWPSPYAADPGEYYRLSAAFATSGAFPLAPGGSDAALCLDLPAGSYTMHIRGAGNNGRTVLVEAYEVPPPSNPEAEKPPGTLEVRNFTVPHETDGYFRQYIPRFTLVETTGQGAAIVVSVVLKPEGTLWFGPPPTWSVRMPVGAGGTLSIGAPAGSQYGGPFGFEAGPLLATGVTAIITYRVSDGSERVVSARAPVVP